MSGALLRRIVLIVTALGASQARLQAADDETVPLNELTARMRDAGRPQAEIDAFLAWQIALRGTHAYLAMYRRDHDAARLRAIAGLRPPTAMVMAELWPLLNRCCLR